MTIRSCVYQLLKIVFVSCSKEKVIEGNTFLFHLRLALVLSETGADPCGLCTDPLPWVRGWPTCYTRSPLQETGDRLIIGSTYVIMLCPSVRQTFNAVCSPCVWAGIRQLEWKTKATVLRSKTPCFLRIICEVWDRGKSMSKIGNINRERVFVSACPKPSSLL